MKKLKNITILALFILFLCGFYTPKNGVCFSCAVARADSNDQKDQPISGGNFGTVLVDRVDSVDSNFTIVCDIEQWPAVVGKNMPVRIAGAKPTSKSDNHNERENPVKNKQQKYAQDYEATKFTAEMLNGADVVVLDNIRRGQGFYIVADVYADGQSVAATLINKGLAKSCDMEEASERVANVNIIMKRTKEGLAEIKEEKVKAAAAAYKDNRHKTDRQDEKKLQLVGSKNSKVFHKSSCWQAGRISKDNLVMYKSLEDAEARGKRPCKICKPGR